MGEILDLIDKMILFVEFICEVFEVFFADNSI